MKEEIQKDLEHLCHCMEWRIASEGVFSLFWSPNALELLRCTPSLHITCALEQNLDVCDPLMKRLYLAYTVFTSTNFLSRCAQLCKCIKQKFQWSLVNCSCYMQALALNAPALGRRITLADYVAMVVVALLRVLCPLAQLIPSTPWHQITDDHAIPHRAQTDAHYFNEPTRVITAHSIVQVCCAVSRVFQLVPTDRKVF